MTNCLNAGAPLRRPGRSLFHPSSFILHPSPFTLPSTPPSAGLRRAGDTTMERIATMPPRLHLRTALYDEMAALLHSGPVSVSYDELAYEQDRVAAVAVRQAMRKRGLNVHVYRQKTIIAVEKKKPATK